MEPTELVLDLLRDIRAKLAEHDERFDELARRFNALDQRLDELGNKVADWRETMAGAADLSLHADSRDPRIGKRLADLTRPSTVAGDEISDALVAGNEASLAPYKAVRRDTAASVLTRHGRSSE